MAALAISLPLFSQEYVGDSGTDLMAAGKPLQIAKGNID